MAKIRKVFTGGNTSEGFYSLHNNIISEDRNKLYILKGMPGGGKSSMMRDIGVSFFNKGYDIEFHHCPSDPNSIDAIVIEELGICMLDGTAPHVMDPEYPGMTDEIIDLAKSIDPKKLIGEKEDAKKAKKQNKNAYRKAFNYFRAAGDIYREIEAANKSLVDMSGVNKEIAGLIEKVFAKDNIEIRSNGFKERHLFSTANSPEGFVDYTDSVIEGVEDVYYISGEIGVGIPAVIRAVANKASIMNYDIEIYHNSTMPETVETIYIKDIDTIITSNESGKKYGNVIDLNKHIDLEKIDNKDYEIYEMLIRKGIESLGNAKKNHFILERAYRPSIDYTIVDKVKARVLDEIMEKIKA